MSVAKRLRSNADFLHRKGWSKSAVLEREAADEIERLMERNRLLQELLDESVEDVERLRGAK